MEIKKENAFFKVSSFTRIVSAPKSFLHWHHNYEICQVLGNRMCFLVNGVSIEAQEGDVVVIGENVVHQFLATYGPAYVRIMQFSLKVLMEAGIPLKRCKAHITAEEISQIPGLNDRLMVLFEIIEAEGCAKENEANYYLQSMVAGLYCLLTRFFAQEGDKDFTKEQKTFQKVLEYVNEHFEEDINVNILAERFSIHRGTISALFMKHSGIKLNEYVYSLRIKKANELMNQGRSIIEVALESGFSNIRTFNNVYKRITGITPTQYKKRNATVVF